MAGHSKWANIKHRKAKQDAKKGKIFTRLIRELTVAARLGGGDPESNPRLRAAITTALNANMTRDTVDRAVKRGAGDDTNDNMEEIRYEGYGVNGIAVMVECLSDNRNRTVSEVRHAFTKSGGNLGTDGSVSYLFEHRGVFSFDESTDIDALMEAAIELGAEDVLTNDDQSHSVICESSQYNAVFTGLEQQGFTPLESVLSYEAETKVMLDAQGAEKLLKMIDLLEECDDVQNVYHNADISPEVLDTLNG